MEDYYLDELMLVLEEYGVLHEIGDSDDEPVESNPTAFLGDGGEWV